jgi:hypothetical protein
VPGRSGKYLLSIRVTKSLGFGRTGTGMPCVALAASRLASALMAKARTRMPTIATTNIQRLLMLPLMVDPAP